MKDKNLIILGLILAIIFGGVIWYYAQQPSPQKAAISEGLAPQREIVEEGPEETGEPVLTGEPILGNPEAPVTIVEYFSYMCGHCRDFYQETFPQIKENYIKTGQVKFIIRQLFGAPELPEAALCAGEQNRFWDYHEYLFAHLQELQSENDLVVFAQNLGLEKEVFSQCLNSGRYQETIQNWAEAGEAEGLTGVPAFLIGSQKIVGNQPYEEFVKVIEEELAKNK